MFSPPRPAEGLHQRTPARDAGGFLEAAEGTRTLASRPSFATRPGYRTRILDPIPIMNTMPEPQRLHVNVHHEENAFWATVDEFPGVFAPGDDLDELRESLQEGIALILAPPGEEPPPIRVGALQLEPVAMSAGAEPLYA